MKKCSNCFKSKALSEFYVKRTDKYNLHQARCKACNAEICYTYANKHRQDKIEKYFERKEMVGAS